MGFFKRLWRKRLSLKDQMRLQFRDVFEESVRSKEVKKAMSGVQFIDDMLIQEAISITYDSIKNEARFAPFSALCILKQGFDPTMILEEELDRALRKYCPSAAPRRRAPEFPEDELLSDVAVSEKKDSDVGTPGDAFLERMEEKFGVSKEEVEAKIEELGLAPDLSKNNELENKLFAIAKEGVRMIEREFRPLSREGYAEALILCSAYLIDLGTEHQNTIDLDIFEDRYFLLLADEVLCNSSVDDNINYINSRVGFYDLEDSRCWHPTYTPMFVYNALYQNPGCESPNKITSFSESPIILLLLHKVLQETKSMMRAKAEALGYSIPEKLPF